MLEIASQITICLLLAALIGFIIGYIVAKGTSKKPAETNKKTSGKKTKEKTKPETKKPVEEEVQILVETISQEIATEEIDIPTAAATQAAVKALEELNDEAVVGNTTEKPELLNEAKDGKKDALTQIKGIGPKVEEKLNEAGIYHFSQIANWTEANIQWLELNTTFAHRAKKDLWVNQAKSLV